MLASRDRGCGATLLALAVCFAAMGTARADDEKDDEESAAVASLEPPETEHRSTGDAPSEESDAAASEGGTPEDEEPPDRSLRVGASALMTIFEPFENTERWGTGVFGSYEYIINPAFHIGVNMSYRIYPVKEQLHQVGYGMLMRHYLTGTDSPDAVFMPFLEYGLLLQIHVQSEREGTGTSHDTRLCAGTDLRILDELFFVAASWHYSRLSLFGSEEHKLDYVELDLGYRYDW